MKKIEKREQKREKFIVHCDRCGRLADSMEGWQAFQPKSRGTLAYMCPDCMKAGEPFRKHDLNNRVRWGEADGDLFRLQFNIVASVKNDACKALLLSRDYGMAMSYTPRRKEDTNAVLIDTLVYPSLHGLKRSLYTFDECIQKVYSVHINMYTCKLDNNVVQFMETNKKALKSYVGKYNAMANGVIFETEYKGADVLFYDVNRLKDIITMISKELVKGENVDRIMKRIDSINIRYAKGEANCQRPERNSLKKGA